MLGDINIGHTFRVVSKDNAYGSPYFITIKGVVQREHTYQLLYTIGSKDKEFTTSFLSNDNSIPFIILDDMTLGVHLNNQPRKIYDGFEKGLDEFPNLYELEEKPNIDIL